MHAAVVDLLEKAKAVYHQLRRTFDDTSPEPISGQAANLNHLLVRRANSGVSLDTSSRGGDPKLVANWTLTELFGASNRAGRDLAHSPITPDGLSRLVDLIQDGTISGRIAKDVFRHQMFETGADPAAIIEQQGPEADLGCRRDRADRRRVIAANPDQVGEAAGQSQVFGWFVGQVMKATEGQANPELVNEDAERGSRKGRSPHRASTRPAPGMKFITMRAEATDRQPVRDVPPRREAPDRSVPEEGA